MSAELARLIDAAARYIGGNLAFARLLKGTDPEGWGLAPALGAAADRLGAGRNTAAWVEDHLPRVDAAKRFSWPPPR